MVKRSNKLIKKKNISKRHNVGQTSKKLFKKKNISKKIYYGGLIKFDDFQKKHLALYYIYGLLCRDYLIPQINIDGVVCNSNIDTLDLLFKGANGFALKFICKNGNTYTLKLLYNNQQMSGMNESFPRFEEREKPKICNEFTSINRFDSIYIMKAYKYFLYDKTQFILSSQCNVARRTDIQYIKGDTEKKIVNVDGNRVDPMFSGLLLEYVQHGILDILSMPPDILTKKNIISLFLNYLYGLKTISDNSFLHKDIKLNNLMFNINPDKTVIGKIIDFGETFELKNVFSLDNHISFAPCSTDYAPMLFDVQELMTIYDVSKRRSVTAAQQLIIDEIRTKYDLYSLSKSFLNDLIPHIKGIDFSDFIKLVLIPSCNENFRDRLDIDETIGLTLSMI